MSGKQLVHQSTSTTNENFDRVKKMVLTNYSLRGYGTKHE